MKHESRLETFRLDAGLAIAQASASHNSPVDLGSPAWEVVTDLTLVKAATAQPALSLRHAEQMMIFHGVRMLFVVDEAGELIGLVTSTDLHGDRQVRLVQERHARYDDLCVADVMTGLNLLDAVDFDALKDATVGDLVGTLERFGRHHMLVVQAATHATPRRMRGVISRSQVERQLGALIDATPVASTFSEIEQALRPA